MSPARRLKRDVLAAFAQRRYAQLDDVEAVVEVLAEAPGADFGGEVLVGGAEDAHVDGDLLLAADRAHGLFLDRPEQFDLHGHRQVGDFVEEQGAAAGGLEQALLVFDSASEAAFLVAEELAFHQFGGNRAAVHRHERPLDTWPLLVDQARHQLLAATGLATDVDRRLAARQLADLVAQGAHRRRLAEQAVVHRRFLGFRVAQAQGGCHQLPQATEVDRFGEEVEGTGLERLDRGVQAAVRGDHGHRGLWMALLDVLDQIEAAAVRQAHVGEAQVERLAGQQLAGFLDVAGAAGVQLHAAESDFQQFADIRFIVDDQGFLSAHACGFRQLSLRGWAKVMRKQPPPSSRLR